MRLDELSLRDLIEELLLLPFQKRLLLIAGIWLLVLVLGVISLVRSGHQRAALNDVVNVRIPIIKSLAILDDGVSAQAIQFRNLALWETDEIRQRAHGAHGRSGRVSGVHGARPSFLWRQGFRCQLPGLRSWPCWARLMPPPIFPISPP